MHEAEYPYIYRENATIYLDYLSKLIYNRYGNVKVDMLIAGGSAIILKHNFRPASEDIDSYIDSSVDISNEIYDVAVTYGITSDWLNSDFTKSKSFSPRLLRNAEFYRNFNGILNVFVVCDLDLICMKLVSFRDKDISDLINLFKINKWITQQILIDRLIYLYKVANVSDILSYNARVFVTSLKLNK